MLDLAGGTEIFQMPPGLENAVRARSKAKITERCLQLFDGYGYMEQYHPISRMYGDARVTRIYVRTNEFM